MSQNAEILVVEDDRAIALVIAEALGAEGYQVSLAQSLAERDRALAAAIPAILITDVVLPDGDGLETLGRWRDDLAATPVIVLSAQNTLDTAVRAAGENAFDYLPKPFDLDELVAAVRSALDRSGSADAALPAQFDADTTGLVGRAPAMQSVFRTIARLAGNDLAVLILGESGSGKEVVAQAIHRTGRRANGPFVAINMAAIPRELIEAELFGHEKGAFTGAVGRVEGRFEQARGGTLFLDEIGDMPMEAQTRLLRVLQSGEFSTVGGTRPIRSDVRIIAATHQNLPQLVSEGRFRQDLYFRLNVIPISIPPLRERRSDIPDLVRHFLAGAGESGLPTKSIMPDAVALLAERPWPGNVRELGNCVQRLVLLSRDTVIRASDIDALADQGRAGSDTVSADVPIEARIAELIARWTRERTGAANEQGELYDELLALIEPPLIAEVLRYYGGSQVRAAKAMGINRNTLRKKIEAAHTTTDRR